MLESYFEHLCTCQVCL